MSAQQFEATVLDINGLKIIQIPKPISSYFPSRGMVMARGMINDYSILVALEPDGLASHWFTLEPEIYKLLHIQVGDVVIVSLEVEKLWPKPEVPKDIVEALEVNELHEQWITLTSKAQWDWIRWIRSTKASVTRAKRIEVMCSKLEAGDRRPCCFNRNLCTVTKVSKSGILMS